MASEFLELLSQINDPRRGQGKKWQLGPILLATILAVLSGATSYRKVHGFIKAHGKRLNKAFGFGWKSAPAYSAVRTILRGLDGGDMERVFRSHAILLSGGQLSGAAAGADASHLGVVAIVRRAKDRSWELRFDISFYVCSAPITARKAADAIRGHWSIENRNHYVRDVAMLEDASRIRKNPGIFARVRSFALNILRANGENNISQAMWDNVLDITRPLNYRFM